MRVVNPVEGIFGQKRPLSFRELKFFRAAVDARAGESLNKWKPENITKKTTENGMPTGRDAIRCTRKKLPNYNMFFL